MATEEHRCPYCNAVMNRAYFVISGGVWLCEDKDFMEHQVAGDLDSTPYATKHGNDTFIITSPKPLHCVIGAKGYHGAGKWPKEGFFCNHCLTFVINPGLR